MNTIPTPPSQPTQESTAPDLMYLYGSTETSGLTYGSSVSVPEGYSALVVVNDKPLDAVGPGEYTIDAAQFPELARSLRLAPGTTPSKPVKMTVYLLNVAAAPLPWRALPTVTRNRQHGLTYCDLRGTCTVRVANPTVFFNSYKKGVARIVQDQPKTARPQLLASPPGVKSQLLVQKTIGGAAGIGMKQLNLAPEQVTSSALAICNMIGAASNAALQAMGLECASFDITVQPEAQRSPCSKCGSATAPTGYAVFRRTISMLYVRFGAKREGNFCVPCAAKISAGYNGTMLICGWWGYIGIVLTPIYLVQNCYHFLNCAFGPKSASGIVALIQAAEGSWPPAPTVDWGGEVQEQ